MPKMRNLVPWRVRTWMNASELFGVGTFDYLVASATKRPVAKLDLKDIGDFSVRVHDSDLECLIQVFTTPYDPESEHHRRRLMQHYDALIAKGLKPVIIDAGANIGAAAVWFARTYPEAIVLAVEPDPANAAMARTNTAHYANVTVVEAGLGGKPGLIAGKPGDASWGNQSERSQTGTIPIVTMADLQDMAGPDASLFIVKIDIEGFESDVFAGDTTWIGDPTVPWSQGPAMITVEPHDWMLPDQGTSATFQEALLGKGFELLIRGENLLLLRPSASALVSGTP